MDDSNIIAFPSKKGQGYSVKPEKAPDIKISHELTELAKLNRRLIALTDFMGQRISEQERRILQLERRLIQLSTDFYSKS